MSKTPVMAYSYARISTKKQERGSGIQRQMRQSREYAAKYGLVLDESLQDIGVSAFTGANVRKGALGRFLSMVEEERIAPGSYLLVENLDRLSRDKVRKAMPIFLDIINAGIVIITLGDGNRRYDIATIDADPFILMTSLVVMTRGNEESSTKRFRTGEWWKAQIAKARVTPGFKVKGQNPPGWMDKDWKPVEPVVAIVRKAYELADTGMGQQAIAKHLNSIGAPTLEARRRRGGGWYQSTINGLLTDRRVLGEWQPTVPGSNGTMPDGPPIEGYCEAIISPALFERVQAKRAPLNRAKVATNKGKITNLFGGRIRCNCCAGSMTIVPNGSAASRKTVSQYLKCSNRTRKVKACEGTGMFNYGFIEDAILTNLPQIPWADILKRERPDDPSLKLALEIDDAESEASKLRTQVENGTAAIMAGLQSPSVIKALKDAEDQLAAVEARLKELRAKRTAIAADLGVRPDLLVAAIASRDALAGLQGTDLYEARARLSSALQGIVKGIFLDGRTKKVQVWISETYRMEWKAGKQPTILHRLWIDHPTQSVVVA